MFSYGLTIATCVGILASSFVIFPLNERITNAKQVQLMTGLGTKTFWLSNIIWDFFIYGVSVAFSLSILMILDEENTFTDWTAAGIKKEHKLSVKSIICMNSFAGALALILSMFGIASLPFSYIISLVAKSAASGFSLLIVINILGGRV